MAARASGVEFLRGLEGRKRWPVKFVKVNSSVPEIRARIMSPSGQSVEVHAWQHNDFNTPMMRLDSSDLLYALTDFEFETLCAVAASQASSGATE